MTSELSADGVRLDRCTSVGILHAGNKFHIICDSLSNPSHPWKMELLDAELDDWVEVGRFKNLRDAIDATGEESEDARAARWRDYDD